MIFNVMFLMLTSCNEAILDREKFENTWWEFEQFPICFNVHESGDLLIFEDRIRSEGEWSFANPNSYIVQDDMFDVREIEENCWDIFLHSKGLSDTACECTLRD
tara:strand:+ start:529 stop:840 length:312 start_codon:yes stop_codon:yes gene_type:complete